MRDLELELWAKDQRKKLYEKWVSEGIEDVIFDDFFSYQVGIWYTISDNVKFKLLQKTENHIVTLCYFMGKAKVNAHYHSDAIELFYLIEGDLTDNYNGVKFVKNKPYIYDLMKVHEMYSNEGCKLLIKLFREK